MIISNINFFFPKIPENKLFVLFPAFHWRTVFAKKKKDLK
jgi:hypothetical protein